MKKPVMFFFVCIIVCCLSSCTTSGISDLAVAAFIAVDVVDEGVMLSALVVKTGDKTEYKVISSIGKTASSALEHLNGENAGKLYLKECFAVLFSSSCSGEVFMDVVETLSETSRFRPSTPVLFTNKTAKELIETLKDGDFDWLTSLIDERGVMMFRCCTFYPNMDVDSSRIFYLAEKSNDTSERYVVYDKVENVFEIIE